MAKNLKNLWDRKRSLVYIKVGSFFLVAFFLFFITLLSIREVSFFKGTYPLIVKFEFAEGLRPSAPVRFCGVDVGEIKKVTVKKGKDKPVVYVHVKVQKGIMIPKESHFFVNSLSLFGEKYLEINPPESVKSYLAEGDVVEGISPIPLFSIFATFTKTMKEVREFVKEGKIKTSFENIISNMEEASLDIKGLFSDVRDKAGTFGRLLYDDSLYKVTEEFITDLKNHPWKLLHKPKETKKRQ